MPDVRKPKSPLSAWIVENRKRLGWKSEELAQRLDVSDSAVRGWESGRAVSEPNLLAMERLFGVQSPDTKEPGGLDSGLIVALSKMLEATAQALTDVRLELREARLEASQERAATAQVIGHLSDQLDELRDLVGTRGGYVAPDLDRP